MPVKIKSLGNGKYTVNVKNGVQGTLPGDKIRASTPEEKHKSMSVRELFDRDVEGFKNLLTMPGSPADIKRKGFGVGKKKDE